MNAELILKEPKHGGSEIPGGVIEMITCRNCDSKIAVCWRNGMRVRDGEEVESCKDCD